MLLLRRQVWRLCGLWLVLLLGLTACIPFPFVLPTPVPPTPASGQMQVHFIDVGQGDAILIVAPGGELALIDAGEKNSGALEYLQQQGVDHLDLVVATHPHDDHIGGLPKILRSLRVKRVVTSGQEHTSATYEAFLDAIVEAKAEYVEVRRGDQLPLGSLILQVLSPGGPQDGDNDLNNASIVLRLVYGRTAFLFTGDAEKPAEDAMLAAGMPLQADVLKVAHHASTSSNTPAFLQAVKPQLAIYFAEKGNMFGHPHIGAVNALKEAGAKVVGTDTFGTLVVTADGSGFQVYSEKGSLKPVAGQPLPRILGRTDDPASSPPQALPKVTPTPAPMTLQIQNVTKTVSPGDLASLTLRTAPGARASITVYTKSGASSAKGLAPKRAGKDGLVTWEWRVGATTTPGKWKIVVTVKRGSEELTREITYTVKK